MNIQQLFLVGDLLMYTVRFGSVDQPDGCNRLSVIDQHASDIILETFGIPNSVGGR